MPKPWIHAVDSAKRHGGKPEDYEDIHELMDSSKAAVPSNLHRCLTHQSWFVATILPKVFGNTRKNSDGKVYSVRDIGEEHCLMDFAGAFIPTPQDYLAEIEFKDWMQNGQGAPPSFAKIYNNKKRFILVD